MKRLLLMLCLFTITLTTTSATFVTPVVVEKQIPWSGQFTDGTYVFTVYFDTTSTEVTDVQMDGGGIVTAFLNRDITYDAVNDVYTVIGLKIKYSVGGTNYNVLVPNAVLNY